MKPDTQERLPQSCKNCPFRKGNGWHYAAEGKVLALQETARQGIFSCHMRHPDRNIFSIKDMEHDDCAGFAKMKINRESRDAFPDIVNGFNETGPQSFDLIPWFYKHSNDLNMLKLI